MYNSCTYNVHYVQVLKISFWHALLLQTWQKKRQAHCMLHYRVHADKTSSVSSEYRAQQLRLVELGEAIEEVSWQLVLLLPMQA